MSAGIYAKSNGTQGALQVNAADSVVFDSTGIVTGAGKRLAQIITVQTGTLVTGTAQTPYDTTIPQSSENDLYLSATITPTNVNSLLEISAVWVGSSNVSAQFLAALYQDAGVNALAVAGAYQVTVTGLVSIPLTYYMTAGSLAATTFKIRLGTNNPGTVTMNGISGVAYFGGTVQSRITIKEYLP